MVRLGELGALEEGTSLDLFRATSKSRTYVSLNTTRVQWSIHILLLYVDTLIPDT